MTRPAGRTLLLSLAVMPAAATWAGGGQIFNRISSRCACPLLQTHAYVLTTTVGSLLPRFAGRSRFGSEIVQMRTAHQKLSFDAWDDGVGKVLRKAIDLQVWQYGNFDIILDRFPAHISAIYHPAPAVLYVILGAHAIRRLIGAWNPMLRPIESVDTPCPGSSTIRTLGFAPAPPPNARANKADDRS